MKICVIGANGMLGWSFVRRLSAEPSVEVVAITRSPFEKTKESYIISNFLDQDAFKQIFYLNKFDWIINCAGAIKQRDNIQDHEMIEINASFPHRLRSYIDGSDTQLLNFSTDCVFSGKKGDYSECDQHDSDDIYGKTKSLGELSSNNCLTLRTSIIGHGFTPNKSLIDWFISNTGQRVKGFENAIYTGFPTIYVANFFITEIMQQNRLTGTFNFSSNKISKYDLLSLVNEQYKTNIKIDKCSDLRIDRSLNSKRLRKLINWTPPDWEELIIMMKQDYYEWRQE